MIRVKHIEVEADKGTNKWDAIRKAVALAMTEGRDVTLTFNDQRLVVRVDDIVNRILDHPEG